MGTLVFVCPTSCREVFTGLEIDPASFQGISKVLAEIKCPDVGNDTLTEIELTDTLTNIEALLREAAEEKLFPSAT
jgi:hypothetical protein